MSPYVSWQCCHLQYGGTVEKKNKTRSICVIYLKRNVLLKRYLKCVIAVIPALYNLPSTQMQNFLYKWQPDQAPHLSDSPMIRMWGPHGAWVPTGPLISFIQLPATPPPPSRNPCTNCSLPLFYGIYYFSSRCWPWCCVFLSSAFLLLGRNSPRAWMFTFCSRDALYSKPVEQCLVMHQKRIDYINQSKYRGCFKWVSISGPGMRRHCSLKLLRIMGA